VESKRRELRGDEEWMESTLLSTTKKRKHITKTNCVGRQRHDEGEETPTAQKEGQQEVIKLSQMQRFKLLGKPEERLECA